MAIESGIIEFARACALCLVMAFVPVSATAAPDVRRGDAPEGPAPGGPLGLYAPDDFVVTSGDGSPLDPSPKLYFAKEWIAVPREGVPVAGFARGVIAPDDVRAWSATADASSTPGARPPLVWIAAPERLRNARIAKDFKSVAIDNRVARLTLAPKLALNRSWFDATSDAYFAERPVALRGEWRGAAFEARTLWPEDFRLDAAAALAPLPADRPAAMALRDLVRADDGGARKPFSTRVLWARDDAARTWAGKPAIVVVLNGAQGDDDEAWAGHFAIATGRVGADGGLADFLVDNFYSLDVVSEKGILAAPVPLDNYLADLNSGQAWYRPSALMVAVLADEAAAARVQGAFNRVYPQFWRHQLPYQHSTMNCGGISVDTLRALGLALPSNDPGIASIALAWLAVPWTLAKERSVSQARIAYEYLTQDRTRLFPAVAFETAGAELLRLASSGASPKAAEIERLLARDLEALVLVHVPQLPSSRAFGSWPVASPAEYHGKVPRDPQDVQIVPVPARPFPSNLREPDLLPEARRPSDLPFLVWGIVALAALAALVGWAWRRWVP
ncbi:MAG: hypothetical protein ABI585_03275 [Betaproteobacteria bacterium]